MAPIFQTSVVCHPSRKRFLIRICACSWTSLSGRQLPPSVTDHDAACLDPATCAMAAIRDADARIGDSVVVFGLGAIGLMTVQLLRVSGTYKALRQAMRSVRQCGSITTIGYYEGKDMDLALGEEWMHNRLTMKCSLPAWGNPFRDYPVWDGQRAWFMVMQMFSNGKIKSAGVIDPLLCFEDSIAGIMNVYCNQEMAIKIGIQCNG